MSSPIIGQSESTMDIESDVRPVDPKQQSSWLGRQVKKIPFVAAFSEASSKDRGLAIGTIGVVCGISCFLIGGTMWARYPDDSHYNNVGQILTWVGVGFTGLSCCCGITTACNIGCFANKNNQAAIAGVDPPSACINASKAS